MAPVRSGLSRGHLDGAAREVAARSRTPCGLTVKDGPGLGMPDKRAGFGNAGRWGTGLGSTEQSPASNVADPAPHEAGSHDQSALLLDEGKMEKGWT